MTELKPPEPPVREFFVLKGRLILELMILLSFDASLLFFWLVVNWSLDRFSHFFHCDGVASWCVEAAHKGGSYTILALIGLEFLKDIAASARSLMAEFRWK